MAEKLKFTEAAVARLACPAERSETIYWDAGLPGFGVRCMASGARRFVVQYRAKTGPQRRQSLGDPSTVRLEEARTEARNLLARVRLGGDPQGEQKATRKREREAMRVGTIIDLYLIEAAKRMRRRSLIETTRHLKGGVDKPAGSGKLPAVAHAKPLHDRIAAEVSRRDIAKLLGDIAQKSGGTAANRVRSSLSAMWTWAVMAGLQEANPVAETAKPGVEASRERVLTDAELAAIWDATDGGDDHDRIVRLLMLTGCRRDEVGRMMWSEVAGDLWTVPAARSKNGLPHEVPLSALAITQLPARRTVRVKGERGATRPRDTVFGKLDTGFAGWSRCKERLDGRLVAEAAEAFRKQHGRDPADDEARVEPWRLHDLRRTMVTRLNDLGLAEPHIIEAMVNHASGSARRGVAGVYNRAAYRDQKRAALATWADHIASLVGQSTANVVTLGRA